eukprot:COSAG06_NODE_1068_length_10831_cov_4.318300_4_plen_73_part_00
MAAQAVQLNGKAPLEPSGSVLPPLYLPRPREEHWFKNAGADSKEIFLLIPRSRYMMLWATACARKQRRSCQC